MLNANSFLSNKLEAIHANIYRETGSIPTGCWWPDQEQSFRSKKGGEIYVAITKNRKAVCSGQLISPIGITRLLQVSR